MPNLTTAIRNRRDEKGFTLIEVLVVLGFIAVLSGLGMASIRDTLQRARAARTASDLVIVSSVIEQYVMDHGELPGEDNLGPVTAIEPLLVPAYTRNLPTTDGWGNEIFYERVTASGKNDNKKGGAGGQESVVICHRTGSGSNPQVTITVAIPSVVAAHLRHGDSLGECAEEEEEEEEEVDEGSGAKSTPVYRVYSYGRDGLPDGDVVTGLYYGSSSDIVVENGMLVQWAF